jgi:hypothetical protein
VWNGTTLVTKDTRGHEPIQSQPAKRTAVPRAVALPSLETPQPKSPAKFHNLQVHPQQKRKKKRPKQNHGTGILFLSLCLPAQSRWQVLRCHAGVVVQGVFIVL